MKKSFLTLFALLATLSLSATQYALIGGNIGWNFADARNYVFQPVDGKTNLYTITVAEIYGDFKIVDVDVDVAEWAVQYGAHESGHAIAKGGNYGLKAKNGSNEPQNLTIGGAIYQYTNATFTLEVQENGAHVLTFVSGTTALRNRTVQIVGDYNSWKLEDAVQFEANTNGVLCAAIPTYRGSSKLILNRDWAGAYGSNGTLMSVGSPYVLAPNGGNLFCTNPFLVYTDVQLTLTLGDNDEVILTAVGGTPSTTEYEIPKTLRLTGTSFNNWTLEDDTQIMQPVEGQPYTYSLTRATIKGDLKLTNGTWNWFFGKNANNDKWVVNEEYTMGFLTDNLQAANDTEYTDVTITVVFDVENGTAKLTIRDANAPTALPESILSDRATKRIENGQLVIIKNGVRYNALGTTL